MGNVGSSSIVYVKVCRNCHDTLPQQTTALTIIDRFVDTFKPNCRDAVRPLEPNRPIDSEGLRPECLFPTVMVGLFCLSPHAVCQGRLQSLGTNEAWDCLKSMLEESPYSTSLPMNKWHDAVQFWKWVDVRLRHALSDFEGQEQAQLGDADTVVFNFLRGTPAKLLDRRSVHDPDLKIGNTRDTREGPIKTHKTVSGIRAAFKVKFENHLPMQQLDMHQWTVHQLVLREIFADRDVCHALHWLVEEQRKMDAQWTKTEDTCGCPIPDQDLFYMRCRELTNRFFRRFEYHGPDYLMDIKTTVGKFLRDVDPQVMRMLVWLFDSLPDFFRAYLANESLAPEQQDIFGFLLAGLPSRENVRVRRQSVSSTGSRRGSRPNSAERASPMLPKPTISQWQLTGGSAAAPMRRFNRPKGSSTQTIRERNDL